jgi:hypothetical protein
MESRRLGKINIENQGKDENKSRTGRQSGKKQGAMSTISIPGYRVWQDDFEKDIPIARAYGQDSQNYP